MKRTLHFGALLVLLFANASLSQDDRSVKMARPQDFGLGFEVGMYHFSGDVQEKSTTFTDAKSSWNFGGNLQVHYRLTTMFDSMASLNFRGLAGVYPMKGTSKEYEFKNTPIGAHVALQLELFNEESIRPFVSAGIGFVMHDPKVTLLDPKFQYSWDKNKGDGTAGALVPLAIGLNFSIASDVDLYAKFEKSMTLTDNIDNWDANINDNWETVTLGLTWFLGGEEEPQPQPKPVVKDTDGDGLLDQDELTIYKTDPNNRDTDGDGLIDGDEVNQHRTDPTIKDTDVDRLIDGDEVNKNKTNPLNKDTDGDACIDGDEVLDMRTNPLKQDTDGDALTDCDERNVYKTNPLVMDTDGDGVDDGKEVKNGTDPLKADVLKVTAGKNIILEGITFETNKAIIRPESEEILTKAFNTLKSYPEINVEIQGHTDDVGKDAANMTLSNNRAKAVVDWLIAKGIAASRLTAKGYGETLPRAPNTTPENRATNRRIEFRVVN